MISHRWQSESAAEPAAWQLACFIRQDMVRAEVHFQSPSELSLLMYCTKGVVNNFYTLQLIYITHVSQGG